MTTQLLRGLASGRSVELAREAQYGIDMAAVLALVMLPIIAAVGFLFGVLHADGSLVALATGIVFVALATFVLGGAFRIVRDAEGPGH